MIQVKIVNRSGNPLPFYATEHSAGMDLYAGMESAMQILPGAYSMVPTGIFIELPEGYEAQVRPRSGLAAKSGVTVLNTPGTIDADYRGEIKVILINHGKDPFTVNPGDRIAQMIVAKYERVKWEESADLSQTSRGEGGFGHTGK